MAPGEVVRPLRVTAAFRQGWENLVSRFWFLVGVSALYLLIQAPGSAWGPMLPRSPGAVALANLGQFAYSVLVSAPFAVGVAWVHLRVSRGEGAGMNDFLEGWRIWALSVGTYLLVVLAVVAGLVLLVLPGIWVGVRLSLTPFVLLDRREGVVASLKGSWALTRGRFWPLLGLVLLSILVVVAGALALLVGLFVALPWVQQTLATYYRSLVEDLPVEAGAEGPAPVAVPAPPA